MNKIARIAVFLLFCMISSVLPSAFAPVRAANSISPEQMQGFRTNGFLGYGSIALRFIPEDAQKIKRPDVLIQGIQRYYEAYQALMGNTPFQGQQISFVERCNAEEGKNEYTVTPECPYGYAIGYWGYFMGTPYITITKAGIQNVIDDANNDASLTFGIVHELSHAFDYWDNAQYIYNSTTAEAFANVKLVHAIDMAGAPVRLGGTSYSSTKEFLDSFTMSFYTKYVESGYTYVDLDDDRPVVGNKADMYLALIEKGIEKTSSVCFFDTLKQYPKTTTLTKYGSSDKGEKLSQFLSLWSEQCQSSDIVDVFVDAHFPIESSLKDQVAKYAKPIQSTPQPEPNIPVQNEQASSFKDISDHFAEQAILALQKKDIISGKTPTIFAPNDPLNRAEASKLITYAFISPTAAESFVVDMERQNAHYTYMFFKDVDMHAWYAGYIGVLRSYGIIQGDPEGTFRPHSTITRAEFLKMILRARGDDIQYASSTFTASNASRFADVSEHAWYYPIVYAGSHLHIITMQKYFFPDRTLTRGEAALMLQRSL